MKSKFAPAERESLESILESNSDLSGILYMKDILKSFSLIVYVLNEKRQIVFANDVLLANLGLEKDEFILGKRPGEAFGCINSSLEPGGCGTSEACRYCGAVNVILRSYRSKKKEVEETAIVIKNGDYTKQLDLEITATPFSYNKKNYTVVSMADITMKKQKQALEKIFFHDIINIAGSLNGILEFMNEIDAKEREKYFEVASNLSTQIIEEIIAQREMQQAEDGELNVEKKQFAAGEFLKQVGSRIQHHKVAKGKKINYVSISDEFTIETDPVLLTRVLVNMLKNALEAIKEDEEVSYGWKRDDQGITIWVRNNGFIPVHVQYQIFQRSFSTKGKGRGLGTYSIKLIGERYLGGKVGFTSSQKDGTTFFIRFPLS